MPVRPFVLSPEVRRPEGANPRRVDLLYVEDEVLNWEVTELNLRDRYNLTRAVNDRETFEALRKNSYHAILMDIQLANSELDGTEITRVLRGSLPSAQVPRFAQDFPKLEVPIIFMTAYSARYRKEDALSLGADELIYKPVDFTHLALAISKVLLKGVSGARRSI